MPDLLPHPNPLPLGEESARVQADVRYECL